MTIYENNKKKLILEITKFYNTDDLTHLGNAYILTKKLLKANRFPIQKYKKYVSTNPNEAK
jgi:hypothetical protein